MQISILKVSLKVSFPDSVTPSKIGTLHRDSIYRNDAAISESLMSG
jgi:hypothetical protein